MEILIGEALTQPSKPLAQHSPWDGGKSRPYQAIGDREADRERGDL